MPKSNWEYKVVQRPIRPKVDALVPVTAASFREWLNEYGSQGWELVQLVDHESYCVFKRATPRPGQLP